MRGGEEREGGSLPQPQEEAGGSPLPPREDEDEEEPELSLLSRSSDSLTPLATAATAAGQPGGAAAAAEAAASELRPRLIINIMSGWNDEKSVVMGHEEVEPGEEHDRFHDIPGPPPPPPPAPAPPVILRHPRVPPLHGEGSRRIIFLLDKIFGLSFLDVKLTTLCRGHPVAEEYTGHVARQVLRALPLPPAAPQPPAAGSGRLGRSPHPAPAHHAHRALPGWLSLCRRWRLRQRRRSARRPPAVQAFRAGHGSQHLRHNAAQGRAAS